MRHINSIFAHVTKWRLLTGATLLFCLLLGLSLLVGSASASPLPTHPTGTEKHAAQRTDPPGPPEVQTQQHWDGADFAYIFNTRGQVVQANRAVRFDSFPPLRGALRGFMYNPMTGELMARQAGFYQVTFSVTTNVRNVFVLAVNGIPVQGTAYLSTSAAANLVSQNNGQAIIHLNSWDRLTLQNRSGVSVPLAPLLTNGAPGPLAVVNASLLVEQIS